MSQRAVRRLSRFAELDAVASAKIVRVLARIEQGNFPSSKAWGRRVGVSDRFWSRLSDLFRERRRDDRRPADRRNQEAAATRHRCGTCLLAGLQARQACTKLNGGGKWQKQKASGNWCKVASRPTRNSPRRFFAKVSTRC